MKSFALGLCALIATASLTSAAPWMTLTSTSIKDGQRIPVRFGGDDQKRACSPRNPAICPCPGKNVSPQLAWRGAPEGTRSFAILMYDIDGGNGLGSVHWVAYDIPATKTSMAEGEASQKVGGWVGGKNSIGHDHYFGPCGPAGHAPHHYSITVIATDIAPGVLKPGMTRDETHAALRGHTLDSATIVARFARPQ